MKNLVLTVLLLSVAVSCKKKPVSQQLPVMQKEIQIGISKSSLNSMDVFGDGDNIGIYTIAKDNDALFTSFVYENSGYTFGTPYWTAINSDETLMWSDDDQPIYMYAYHPLVNSAGAVTNLAKENSEVVLSYSMPADQSTMAIRPYDLMRAVNTGDNNEGLQKKINGANPVNLKFIHKLCKLQFNVKTIVPSGTIIDGSKAYITNISLYGPQIATEAKLNLKAGTVTPENLNSKLEWNGNTELPVGNDFTATTAVNVADLLVVPFNPANDQNVMEFTVNYNNGVEDVTQTLTSKIPVPAAPTDLTFLENQFNVLTVQITLSKSDISITTTIQDWDSSEHTIDPI